MLPAVALGIRPEHLVLELCAALGSKTLQILELMGHQVGPKTYRSWLKDLYIPYMRYINNFNI